MTAPITRHEAVEGFKLSASSAVDVETLTAADAVYLRVRLENTTTEQLWFAQDDPLKMIDLSVAGENGALIPLTRYGQMIGEKKESRVNGHGIRFMNPGEAIEYVLQVNRLFDLTQSGVYSIQASFSVPQPKYKTNEGFFQPQARIASNVVRIKIIDPLK